MPRLTVLICTHQRAALLARAHDALQAAAPPGPDWQVDILVAANACTDDTHRLLAQRAAAPVGPWPVAWFAEPRAGKSHALNAAAGRVQADWVAFVDDDHRVATDYLRAVCDAAARTPAADLLCGRILPDWDGSEPAWVHDQGPWRIYPLPVPRFDAGPQPLELDGRQAIPGGGNLAVRVPWLHRVGPFATDLGPRGHDLGGSEDLDWVLRALRLGARLRYEPSIVQHHHVDAARLRLSYLVRKAYRRTASTVRVDAAAGTRRRVPRYLWRKLASYALQACLSADGHRRRHFVVRTAAALGELAAHLGPRPGLPDTARK